MPPAMSTAPLSSSQIRKAYLDFFATKGALVLPSFSLVPHDPGLLTTVAGMVPLKPYFVGEAAPPSRRIATSQKCLRALDIEEVGRTPRHHTFFEMLGNFSFGDYFKKEAILWAWEFITEHLHIDPVRLRVTVFHDDDEAYDLWHQQVGLEAWKIERLGEKSNYWPANAPTEGPDGPCGPCSEIFVDMGPADTWGDKNFTVEKDDDRFLEIWNLVFMQNLRKGPPPDNLSPLPSKNIDTGMGLERVTCVLNGVATNYETDLFMVLIEDACQRLGAAYGQDGETDVALRVMADHLRGAAFLIADGVIPTNEGRGYLLRRIIRRAVLKAYQLGAREPVLCQMVPALVKNMGGHFRELVTRQQAITRALASEEDRFLSTLRRGLDLFHHQAAALSAGGELSGEKAFSLYDTFGFPLELTQELLEKEGKSVDLAGFEAAMTQQRERARAASVMREALFDEGAELLGDLLRRHGETRFTGYDTLSGEARVLALIKDGKPADALNAGENGWAVVDATPCYAESGGQASDVATAHHDSAVVELTGVKKAVDKLVLHGLHVKDGVVKTGENLVLKVDAAHRRSTQANHTATHLLHAALRRHLGDHVQQAGSYVGPDKLRFDFSHHQGLGAEELSAIEDDVNSAISDAAPVFTHVENIEAAQKRGAMMIFGEKYGDVVRVVDVPGLSMEFCGGTHVANIEQIGLFAFTAEGSIGSGIRRVEAVTGEAARRLLLGRSRVLRVLESELKAQPEEIPERLIALREEQKTLSREIKRLRPMEVQSAIEKERQKTPGTLVILNWKNKPVDALREMGGAVNQLAEATVLAQLSEEGGLLSLVISANKAAQKEGLGADRFLSAVKELFGGKGGGSSAFAQTGAAGVDTAAGSHAPRGAGKTTTCR